MRLEIKRLQRRLKVTTIYVTHDQIEAMTLADIMVVMKDGHIAQTGSPLEVFENPTSKFVAGFIGSPPMNFIDGAVVAAGSDLEFVAAELRVPLSSERFADLAVGRAVTLGVRPEDLVPDGHGLPPSRAVTISASVSLTEMLGNETLLFITFGTSELVSRMQQPRDVGPEEVMQFRINVDRIHLFDAATGASLRAPVASRAQTPIAADSRPH